MAEPKEELAFTPASPRRGRKWVVLLFTSALLITLFAGATVFWTDRQTRLDFQDPELVISAPEEISFPAGDTFWKTLSYSLIKAYTKTVGHSPEEISFSFNAPRDWEILHVVNSAHQVSGVRYHVERPISEGTVFLVVSNQVNGLEWIAAIEGGLRTGKVSWQKDSLDRTNVVLLEFDRRNKLILSPEKAQEYQRRFPKLKPISTSEKLKR